jgi:outer membrane protein TolC
MLLKILAAAALLTLAMTAGCAKYYTDQADREVYGIVAQKNAQAIGSVPAFNITPPTLPERFHEAAEQPEGPLPVPPDQPAAAPPEMPAPAALEKAQEQAIAQGKLIPVPPAAAGQETFAGTLPTPVPEISPDAIHLTVADTLRLAVRASREYQTQKESVYLTALTLTFQRYLFRPHPIWTGSVNYRDYNTGQDVPDRNRSWTGGSDIGASQQLADGMVIVGDLGLTALKFINQQLGDTVGSTLNFTFDQPLWRGAGREVVQENLVQAERNALYAVRSFARYEQVFVVDIASQYLDVLQNRDIVLNEWANYQSLVENRERAEWLAKAERLPEFQVDQARQDELRAYNRWVVTRQSYVNSLDSFKIVLGIPVTTEVALEPSELARLSAAGLQHLQVQEEQATALALQKRFDLMNARDAVADADRKIKVAENGLAGDVDLVASTGYPSLSQLGGPPQSARLMLNRGNYSIGLAISMPVDRLQERNALRQTQISREAAGRALALSRDSVILQIRRAIRQLEQARESYEIQKRAVELAERRVESTQLLLQAGRAEQRDVLDAQQALVEAQNALTGALVDHSIAALQFQRDVGTLAVNEEGQIHGWILTDSGR